MDVLSDILLDLTSYEDYNESLTLQGGDNVYKLVSSSILDDDIDVYKPRDRLQAILNRNVRHA